MIEPLFLGLFTGIFLGLGFGSVFFALIQDSIDYGWRTGVKISCGVIFGDFMLIAIAYLGTSFLPSIPHFGFYSRLLGALLLIGLGISNLLTKAQSNTKKGKSNVGNFLYFFVKGFLLNVLNPTNFLAWVATSAMLKSYKYSFLEEVLFFIACISSIFLTESIISFYSFRIKDKVSANTIQRIRQSTAIVFFGVAIKLIYDAVKA